MKPNIKPDELYVSEINLYLWKSKGNHMVFRDNISIAYF